MSTSSSIPARGRTEVEIELLQMGNLMGSPDCKEKQWRAGPGTEAAHAVWEEIARIKAAFGLDGRCTSALLREPSVPEAFPAVVDLSGVTPGPSPGDPEPVARALGLLEARGVAPTDVRSVLVTHFHPDHFDPRLLEHLTEASAFGPVTSGHPALAPFSAERFGGLVDALDTPGHGGPHLSYFVDLPQLDLAVCLAGDLIMSHAHFLSLDHPLSFTDAEAGKASVEAVLAALAARGRAHRLIVPGHDAPFFSVD